MQLPHSTSHLETPCFIYSPNQPPIMVQFPAINLHPQVISGIVTMCANEITQGTQAGTPFKIFAYNFFSKGNWQNQDFLLLVSFVVAFVDTEMLSSQFRDPNAIFQSQIIPDAISCYYSQLLSVPNLRSMIDSSTVHALSINAGLFQNKLSQILNLYGRSGVQTPITLSAQGMISQQNQFPNQNMQMMQNMQGMQNNPMNRGMQPPMYQVGNQAFQQRNMFNTGGNNNQFYNGNGNSEIFSNRGVISDTISFEPDNNSPTVAPVQVVEKNPEMFNQNVTIVDNINLDETTRERWRPSEKQPYLVLHDRTKYKAVYYYDEGDVIEIIKPLNESEITMPMDQNKHTVGLLGNTLRIKSPEPIEEVMRQIEKLRSFTSLDISKSREKAGSEKEERIETLEEYIDTHPRCEMFLEEAIFQARKEHIARGNTVFRSFVLIARPLVSKYSKYKSLLSDLFGQRSLSDMSTYLQQMTININQKEEALSDAEQSPTTSKKLDELQELALFFSRVDKQITEVVNSYLRNNISIPVSIESFTSDWKDLMPWVLSRYGKEAMNALHLFDIQAISQFVIIDENSEKDFIERLADNVSMITFLPQGYSLTFVDRFAEQFIPELDKNVPLLIIKDEFPILFDLAYSAEKQRNSMSFVPDYHLLITKDEKVFQLYKGAIGGPETFLISKM